MNQCWSDILAAKEVKKIKIGARKVKIRVRKIKELLKLLRSKKALLAKIITGIIKGKINTASKDSFLSQDIVKLAQKQPTKLAINVTITDK